MEGYKEYENMILPDGDITVETLGTEFGYNYTSGATIGAGGTLNVSAGGVASDTVVEEMKRFKKF